MDFNDVSDKIERLLSYGYIGKNTLEVDIGQELLLCFHPYLWIESTEAINTCLFDCFCQSHEYEEKHLERKGSLNKQERKDRWFAADVFLVPKRAFPNLVSRVLSYYTSPENEGRLFHHVAADVTAAMLVDLPKKQVFLRFFHANSAEKCTDLSTNMPPCPRCSQPRIAAFS